MTRRFYFINCLFLAMLCLNLGACAGPPWPGLPDLPQKDWLNPDKKEKRVPKDPRVNIYSPDKVHTMDDLVWIAVQQSPAVSKGQVNLEICEINKTDAKWRYLPEMHLRYTITNNITRYNEGDKKNMGQDYGETAYQTNFSGYYNNPVETYFSVKAADELLQTAIITQRKAIGELIYQIAQALINIKRLEASVENLQEVYALTEKRAEFRETQEKSSSNVGNPASMVRDSAEELNLQLRETKLELAEERMALKSLIGLEPEQALKIDVDSVNKVLDKIDPASMEWKNVWRQTEDNYLLGQQIKLEQANIWLAWARYLPTISIYIDESPPKGQSQPTGAKTDRFSHITLDFPLLDWGKRWRDADRAEARKRQRQLELIEQERAYGDRWRRLQLNMDKALARQERGNLTAENAKKRLEAVQISYNHGRADYALLADFIRNEADSRLDALKADQGVTQAKLNWIHAASGLTRYYLGRSGYEKAEK